MSSEDKVQEKTKKKEQFSLKCALTLAICASFILFIYAPFEMFFLNKTNFWFDFYTMIGIELVLFILGVGIITLIEYVSFKIHPIVYKIIYCFGIICFFSFYIEGNFLSKDLPLLDGREIDWNSLSVHRIYSIVTILVLVVAVVVLIKIFKYEKAQNYLKYAVMFVSGMLLITLVTISIQNKGFEKKSRLVINKEGEFNYSDKQNIIVLILDAVDQDVFEEVKENHPEYSEVFSDFTNYTNMVSTYTQTEQSVSYLMTGVFYEGKPGDSFPAYVTKEFDESVFFEDLQNRGYRIGYYEQDNFPYSSVKVLEFDNVAMGRPMKMDMASYFRGWIKLIGFRYAPFDLKKHFKLSYREFLTSDDSAKYDNSFIDYNDVFRDDVISSDFTITEDKYFKLYHIEGAHIPFEYDAMANRVGNTTYQECIEASFYVAGEFINRLKEEGVYDNSAIIIMADHGFSLEDIEEDRLHPVFFVKGIDEHHDILQTNDAPLSFEDFNLIIDRLDEGKSSLEITDWKEGDERDRKCYVYFYKEINGHYSECIQHGHAGEWENVERIGD